MKKKLYKFLIIFVICGIGLFFTMDNSMVVMSKFKKSSITILDDKGNVLYKTTDKLEPNEDIIKDNDIADSIILDVTRDISLKYNYSNKEAVAFLNSGNYIIHSTIDEEIQSKVDEVFNNKKSFVQGNPKLFNQAAIVIMDYDGNVKGVRGGNNSDTSINRASRKLLKVGSTIKPVSVYSLGIEKDIINFSSIIDDMPGNVSYKGKTIVWPENFNNVYESNVTVTDALKKSKNTVAVKVGTMIGENEIFNFLKNDLEYSTLYESNIEDDDKQLSALALGYFKNGITLDTLASSYSIFGNSGYYNGTKYYKSVTDEKGNLILEKKDDKKRVISPETASIMNRLLLNNIADEDSIIKNMKNESYEILGKTGTVSDDNKNTISNLFVGMTPEYVGAVWIGYDDMRPMVTGTYRPANNIWKGVFDKINEEKSNFTLSEDMVKLEYCTKSGLIKSDKCNETKIGYYKKSSIPRTCNLGE